MPRRLKSLAYEAGEELARSVNERMISDRDARRDWRKAAKFLGDSAWTDFVAGYNSMMLVVDQRSSKRG